MRRRLLSVGFDPTTRRKKIGGYEVVDLGLPSGLLWATLNIGANSETEYGNYYQWGAGSITGASEDHYYTGITNPLPQSYDTAIQVMGNDFRMPTSAECQELAANTKFTWTTNFNGSGVNGGKYTSKTNPNAYVFFPAGGVTYGGDFANIGTTAYNWSSTRSDSYYGASALYSASYTHSVGSLNREGAILVRGVHTG